MSLKIKVCGLKEKQNILSIIQEKIDFIGFILYKNSKRYILSNNQDVKFLENINFKNKVGVFVNESEENIKLFIRQYKFNYVQLHGNESPEFCFNISKLAKIIKAFSIEKNFNFNILKNYNSFVDFFLFDTKGKNYGGNGYSFDWDLLSQYKGPIPFFLSGGISIEHAEKVKKLNHKFLYGVDINSNFELKPSIKDEVLVKEFTKKIKDGNINV